MTKTSKIREYRKRNGLRQGELARRIGVKQAALSRVEKLGIRSARLAKFYGDALGLDPMSLIDMEK